MICRKRGSRRATALLCHGLVAFAVATHCGDGFAAIGAGAGNAFSVAVKDDGTLHAWGDDTVGELAASAPLFTATPVEALNPGDLRMVARGGDYAMALTSDGTVWSWGSNILVPDRRGPAPGNSTIPIASRNIAA